MRLLFLDDVLDVFRSRFLMYKLPKMQPTDVNYMTPGGGEFVYIDSNTASTTTYWTLSEEDIYEADNPLAYTLAPLYETDKPTDLLYLVYNDQSPDIYSGSRNGHTKGAVMADNTTGIWLQHSMPKFVENLFGGRYTFPDNARENGQAIMCVTFKTSQLNVVGKHLRMQYANVYERGSPQYLRDRLPQMDLLFKDSFIRGHTRKLYVESVTSAAGQKFVSIAKRATLEVDIYSAIVTNVTQTDLLVQSWRNGAGGKMDASCNGTFTVVDVDQVRLKFKDNVIMWSSTEDHSKWAVGIDKPWFCFGSLNRMESQFSRGGEVFCMEHPLVSKLFRRSGLTEATCNIQQA
ncbi:deoxyribonuclease-2-alpha-like isoform X2 [Ornithodoros turicata]|uniref:deoxyribonuclease-2-alpha-like isoform X2 n=1 Tax=Ornithodoros turicata TaxID=34597 RepID=UPI003138EAAB